MSALRQTCCSTEKEKQCSGVSDVTPSGRTALCTQPSLLSNGIPPQHVCVCMCVLCVCGCECMWCMVCVMGVWCVCVYMCVVAYVLYVCVCGVHVCRVECVCVIHAVCDVWMWVRVCSNHGILTHSGMCGSQAHKQARARLMPRGLHRIFASPLSVLFRWLF